MTHHSVISIVDPGQGAAANVTQKRRIASSSIARQGLLRHSSQRWCVRNRVADLAAAFWYILTTVPPCDHCNISDVRSGCADVALKHGFFGFWVLAEARHQHEGEFDADFGDQQGHIKYQHDMTYIQCVEAIKSVFVF